MSRLGRDWRTKKHVVNMKVVVMFWLTGHRSFGETGSSGLINELQNSPLMEALTLFTMEVFWVRKKLLLLLILDVNV